MLLRSSSTPVLGSLISSFITDSPNSNTLSTHHEQQHYPSIKHSRLSLSSPSHQPLSCNSSPYSSLGSIRRAQSDGNLQGLITHVSNEPESHNIGNNQKFSSGRRKSFVSLETIPSFSYYNYSKAAFEDEEDVEEEEEDEDKEEEESDMEEEMERGERRAVMKHGDQGQTAVFDRETGDLGFNQSLFLARGLVVDDGGFDGGFGGGGGGGRGFRPVGYEGDGGNGQNSVEEYYKKMVEENPSDALFLRNYAHFLHQSKKDVDGAEEYYSRAILADPKDGNTLSQYGRLVWELYGDEERASMYFERAVQASPQDSHVHAAYANFLWEAEEDEDQRESNRDLGAVGWRLRDGVLASTDASLQA